MQRRQGPARAATLLITNLAPHYRAPLYEQLEDGLGVQILLHSDGSEWYWQGQETPRGRESWIRLHDLSRWSLGRLAIIAREVGRPQVKLVILAMVGKGPVFVTIITSVLRRKRLVIWTEVDRDMLSGRWAWANGMLRLVHRRAAHVLTYGEHVSRHMRRIGVSEAKITTLPQVTPIDEFFRASRQRTAPVGQPLRLAYVGRLEEWKGPRQLIEAVISLVEQGVEVTLQVAGTGSQRDRLEELAAHLPPGVITFHGFLSRDDLVSFYQSVDVAVIPSQDSRQFVEPWSFVANEAMASGVLVVATPGVGAARHGLVADGRTGIVSTGSTSEELATALRRISYDPALGAALARQGQSVVLQYSYAAAVTAVRRAIGWNRRVDDPQVRPLRH